MLGAASLPPGPAKHWLLGNLRDMPTEKEYEVYAQWGKQYKSDILHMEIFGINIVVLNSLEAVNDLLDRRSAHYSGRAHLPMVMDLMGWKWLLGFKPYGERYHRRIFNEEFSEKAAPRFEPQERAAAAQFLKRLSESPADYLQHVRHWAASLVISIAYGIDIKPVNDPYVKAAEEAAHTISVAGVPGAFLVDTFPWMKHIPEWVPGADFQRKAREWKAIARRMVDLPYATAKSMIESNSYRPSFVSYNLEKPEAHGPKAEYHEEAVKSMAGSMYIAGSDTSITTVLYFILGVLSNPDAQAKAQEEIDRVLPADKLPDFDDEPSLPYVTALVKECLRWKVVTPFAIPHLYESKEDDVYKGCRIPAGSIIMPNSWCVFMLRKHYPDPMKFNPDRFMKDGKLDPNVRDPSCAAFGFGRRVCPGKHMGYASVWLVVASTLATFDIKQKVDDYGRPIPVPGTTISGLVSMPVPFECSITPRSRAAADLVSSL
ncbi:cytochrome P450 [Cylindrobasidium torrendii FP15055 ss-10]|uniref:Cytochrome P450 n=1 Tax=Cylindrobasidium torrendii FP15055 ss-10 TaxID=1314674 RepID=A0A0D7BG31_9AGAR|nr:cytochrome P450 [Cylindrobasidium torrendii FP15055 ss-10]